MANVVADEEVLLAETAAFMDALVVNGMQYPLQQPAPDLHSSLPDYVTLPHVIMWTLKEIHTDPELCLKKFLAVAYRVSCYEWFWPSQESCTCSEIIVASTRTSDSCSEPQQSRRVFCVYCSFCPRLQDLYMQLFSELFQTAKCRELDLREQPYHEPEDFEGVPAKAALVMNCFNTFFCQFQKMPNRMPKEVMCVLILRSAYLVLEHLDEEQPWANYASALMARDLLQSLFKNLGHCSLDRLLCHSFEGGDAGLFGKLFSEMAPFLTRDQWKQNPSVVAMFTTCLFHIQFPHTSDHVNELLPTSLLLTDDIQTHNKVLGVQCLQHITSNVSATELCRYGRAQIISDALEQQLYTREESLLEVALPCVVDILQALEKGESCPNCDHSQHGKMDEVLERILTDMEMEQQLVQRRIYAKHLPKYVSAMGIRVVRHLKRLSAIVTSYLEIHDGSEEAARVLALDVLKAVITEAWLRMTQYCEKIVQSLLRAVCDVFDEESTCPGDVRTTIMDKAVGCLVLLASACPDLMLPLLETLQTVDVLNSACRKVICKTLADPFVLSTRDTKYFT